jgi:hypothetical protein
MFRRSGHGRLVLPPPDIACHPWPTLRTFRRPSQILKTPVVPEEETTMYDIFTAILLAGHLSRRHFEQGRKPEVPCETESPWARIFAWHRRGANTRT